MRETPIGLVIKEIAAEKNLKMAQLVKLSGKTRQGMYVVFGRSEMTNEEIEEWSKVLGVTKEFLFDRWKNDGKSNKEADSTYLTEHLTSLELEFKKLAEQSKAMAEQLQNQLAVKDRQIEKLMDLLGKPEDVIKLRASRSIMPLHGPEALFA